MDRERMRATMRSRRGVKSVYDIQLAQQASIVREQQKESTRLYSHRLVIERDIQATQAANTRIAAALEEMAKPFWRRWFSTSNGATVR